MNDKNKHHYFASCAFGWASAATQDEVVEKLANAFRSDIKKCVLNSQKQGEPGFYVWTCRVHEPSEAQYKIEWFMPKDVEQSEQRHHHITYITAKSVAYYTHKGEI